MLQPCYWWQGAPIPMDWRLNGLKGHFGSSEERKISCPCWDSKTRSSISLSGHYTNYAALAVCQLNNFFLNCYSHILAHALVSVVCCSCCDLGSNLSDKVLACYTAVKWPLSFPYTTKKSSMVWSVPCGLTFQGQEAVNMEMMSCLSAVLQLDWKVQKWSHKYQRWMVRLSIHIHHCWQYWTCLWHGSGK